MKGGNQERLCVACRKLDRKENMIRFVRLDGKAAVDPSGKVQARGAYVCRNDSCIRALSEKHLLRRALRTPTDEEALKEVVSMILYRDGEDADE
ncbi:MAG: YlxR family protein [Lachnospiraceae bacterium]|nr:YlxR family protein [Lachnospiraceae bacterium]